MRQRVLEILKKQNDYLSGEKMSQELDVSRSMVWKVIKGLRDDGYKIDSVTNRGYKLLESPDLVTAEEIQALLTTKLLGRKIYAYKQVDSTNKIAKTMARQGVEEGTVFIAESQTAGKGRLGKDWQSPEKAGIWMSIVLKPEILPQDVSGITLVAGLASCKAIRKVTGLPAYIKWPNDIVIRGKKVCGILTEMGGEIDRVNYVVVGIGINVNTSVFPKDLQEIGTSFKIESGKDYKRKETVAQLLLFLEQYYEKYRKEKSLESILAEYKDLCITLKSELSITSRDTSYLARPLDIDKRGGLMVERQDGQRETITSGQVSVRGIYGYV